MTELLAEYIAAVESMTAADIENLEAQGCRPEIISGLLVDPGISLLGKVCAITHTDGTWAPSDLGQWRYATPAIDGDLIDLIAWQPSAPAKMFTRTGLASLVNVEAVMMAHYSAEPLFLHSNILSWFKADSVGAVPVRFDAGLALALGGVEVICDTPQLARKVAAACDIGRPKISYIRKMEAA